MLAAIAIALAFWFLVPKLRTGIHRTHKSTVAQWFSRSRADGKPHFLRDFSFSTDNPSRLNLYPHGPHKALGMVAQSFERKKEKESLTLRNFIFVALFSEQFAIHLNSMKLHKMPLTYLISAPHKKHAWRLKGFLQLYGNCCLTYTKDRKQVVEYVRKKRSTIHFNEHSWFITVRRREALLGIFLPDWVSILRPSESSGASFWTNIQPVYPKTKRCSDLSDSMALSSTVFGRKCRRVGRGGTVWSPE